MEPFVKSKDKVAIVGFSSTTRDMAPYDDPDYEIWGMNEAYAYPWMKRYERWFQVHPQWDFERTNNDNDPNHPHWLHAEDGMCFACRGTHVLVLPDKKEIPCPHCDEEGIYHLPEARKGLVIYMQNQFDNIPGSAKYPLHEITDAFLGRLRRPYFTSTPSYAVALAAWMGYTTIGLYGFEMGNDTEYHYQRANFEYWLGQMDGRGIKVELPEQSQINTGKLYAYENMQTGMRQTFEVRKMFLENRIEIQTAKVHNINGKFELLDYVIKNQKWGEADIRALMKQITTERKLAKGELQFKKGALQETMNLTKIYDTYFNHEIRGNDPDPEELAGMVNLDYALSGGPDAKA